MTATEKCLRVNKRAEELWEELGLNQHKLDEMCSIHERLPYDKT